MIKISVSGIDGAVNNIGKFARHFTEDVLVGVTEDIYKNAHRNIKPHTKIGRLENNLNFRIQKKAMTAQVFIEDTGMMTKWRGGTNYALFVHFGTKKHPITPRNKKALRWSSGGKFWFSKGHEHPGYKGDPFMTNAAKETMRNIDKIFDRAFKSN